jgi:cobalt-zinc-cadmium efflux system protein
LGWTAVLIIGVAMNLGDYLWLDPLLSIAIACWMSINAFRRLKKILLIFMQSMPDDFNILAVEDLLRTFTPVIAVHDTHVWSLDGTHHVLSTHLVLEKNLIEQELVDLKARIRKSLEQHDIDHATLETELQGEKCELKNCK